MIFTLEIAQFQLGDLNFLEDTRSLLPLTPTVFHMLLALADGEKHGYAIMRAVEEETQGQQMQIRLFSFFSFVPLLFALIGTRLRFHSSAGVPGRLGLVMGVDGCAGMIVAALASLLLGSVAPEIIRQGRWINYVTDVCLLSIMIGYILFGVDTLRYRLLPHWNLSPLLAGSTIVYWFATTLLGVPSYHPLQLLPFVITGACGVLLGIALMDPRREPQPKAAI